MPEIGNKIAEADIDLVDETFERSQAGSYHLSIQIEPGRLSFCVFNTVINKYIVLRNYPLFTTDPHELVSEWSSIFENDELLGLRYKSSSHLWVSPRCTLVPEHLFDPDNEGSLLEFNHGATTGEQVLHNYIRPVGLYNLFSYPESLMALLRLFQPDVKLFHHATPFIASVGTAPVNKTSMSACFYSKYLDITIVKDKELLFYNSFQINTPEDSVYYFAKVSNLFEINPLQTKLIYSGNFKHMPPEVAILKGYVERIVEHEPSNAVTYSHYISDAFRKNFINLFNLYGCES